MVLLGEVDLENETFKRVIEHVFLPQKLPTSEATSLIVDEANLLKFWTYVIRQSYFASLIPSTTKQLFEVWADIQATHVPTAEKIANALSKIEKDEMFGYYVRGQNAALMISMKDSVEGTISTFPVSLKSGTVMACQDVISSFPEQSITIPKSDVLGSKALAHQIVTLTNETVVQTLENQHGSAEIRDVPDTIYVSEWLTTVLSNKASKLDTDFPIICKKVRDNISWDNSLRPYRRSGMWIALKVILQLSLLRSRAKLYSPQDCLVLYKILMAEGLRKICEAGEAVSLDPDIGMFMMKKLARRVMKIKKLPCNSSDVKRNIHVLHQYVSTTIKTWKSKMVTDWEMRIQRGAKTLPALKVNNNDVIHTILPTIPKLENIKNDKLSPLDAPKCFPRHRVSETNMPDINQLMEEAKECEAIGNALFDIEAWIFNNMDTQHNDHFELRQFSVDYVKAAAPYYKKTFNPVGGSRMILAFLQIVRAIDRIAYKAVPLLLDHRVGVDCKIFEQLLLPLRSDMELAHQLEIYFSHRDQKASYPSLIEEDVISKQSFSVRYAERNQQMCDLIDKILADAEDTITRKFGEVKEGKRACANLRAEIGVKHCTGGLQFNGNHVNACAKCHTRDLLNNYRVKVYERPLRNERVNQLAVVFELLIPPEVACLRDVLAVVLSDICCAEKKPYEIENKIWTSHHQLKQYYRGRQKYVQLGSTVKSSLQTHYKEKHPDSEEDQFIVNNHYDCTFDGNFYKTWDVKNYCTLGIPKYTLYSVLEWTLKTTSHTQNQVIARQCECPHEMRITEFKEFGSLRAGHRLQLRNIFRAIVDKSLSFKEEAVFTLICQALWEAGPAQVNGELTWYRDSHADLADKNFTDELLNQLNNLLRTYEHNWAEPYTLMTTIVLACRVLEFGLVKEEACHLILRCRRTALAWIKTIESKACAPDSPISHKQDMKLKLVDACICLCWTYFVGDENLNSVLKSEQDLFYWLHALTRIYNNVTSSRTTKLPLMKKLLLRQVQNVALTIEPKLVNYVRLGFGIFVRENWHDGNNGTFLGWTCFPNPAEQIYHTRFSCSDDGEVSNIQVDILRGSFLINGFPVGYLSESITKHPTFSRVFMNIVFEVLPSGVNTFSTTSKFNEAFYIFTLQSEGVTLIIRERHNAGEEFQLIPHSFFKGLIPMLFVENYSHWLNKKENCIDFRPVCFEDFQKSTTTPTFKFHLGSGKVVETASGRELFYVASPTNASILKFLSRLEHPDYIHTFLENSPASDVIVELPRMNLHFKFNQDLCTLESLEYNMVVRENQNINTLIGLENGLVLENKFKDIKLLMPHGDVIIKSPYSQTAHQKIEIKLNSLKKPALFTFDVDQRLQNLRAGKTYTGWLLLAYLHGLTSSPLPDPFTGLTGTESAFNILQSGHCWSCKPYENESMGALNAIRQMSPVRKYYPVHLKCMEQVVWPESLPVHGAHDGYRVIVDKLVSDSNRLKALFPNAEEQTIMSDGNMTLLTQRAYWRYEGLFSRQLKVRRKFCVIPALETDDKSATDGRTWKTDVTRIQNTRRLAELGHSWTFSTPGSISLLPFLVGRNSELQGLNNLKLVLSKKSVFELQTLAFRDHWIDLYDLARDVERFHYRPEWVLLIATLAFRGVDINQLLLLHCVAVQRVFFQAQHPPDVAKYIEPFKCFFNETEVLSTFSYDIRSAEAIKEAQVLALLLQTLWPIDSCSLETFENLPRQNVGLQQLGVLNSKLCNWNTNRKLDEFLKKIEATTKILPYSVSVNCFQLNRMKFEPVLRAYEANKFALTDFSDIHKELQVDAETKKIFKTKIGLISLSGSLEYTAYEGAALLVHLKTEKMHYQRQVESTYQKIKECFMFPETDCLYQSDLVKLTPASLLRRLLDRKKSDQVVHSLIGALAVLWTLEQRVNRCLLYHSMGRAGSVQLSREQENPGHENWIPANHPEWLLFEIEMNLMIRSVQVDVARQMIRPPLPRGKKHAVMQLNMGEGKTAVIVPLLALSLANGDQLCRVTVLKSLFTTNFSSLVYNLGGLLNRRIYQFPCRRDMPIDGRTANAMLELYKECEEQEGVVLTLPEYRLSFQLKGYERSRAKEFQDARALVTVQKWLADNVRDILDESDEILHAKYQLIYTLGSQLPVDGGQLRWSIAQSLLKLIPERAVQLHEEFGDEFVDATENEMEVEMFHHTRLLRKDCYQQFIDWLAYDILSGKSPGIKLPVLNGHDKQLAHDLLTRTDINEDRHNEALQLFDSMQQESILILMGYLKYEILYLTLSKRWRVNYGVDKDGERKMAIPFRAKDLPAKRTEFGHPDVAIMLTQLSYYYSGLSTKELEECFERLNMIQHKEREYKSWINEIPAARNLPTSISDLSSINLTDFKQKYEILFPALRRNRLVVDFWLSQTVFPKESRAFEKKLACTAWDLCPKSFQNPVTGFSGTNDSTVLLPLPVSQEDLPELQNTNENLRKTILLRENNSFRVLPRGSTGIDILKFLVTDKIPILLDSGALMLELSNEKVAIEWLKLLIKQNCTTYKAAVYFDEDHNLRVKDRDHLDDSSSYDLSPYREQMDQCIVYLDDAHTRGTDLKIPPPSMACVTLCAGMTRDKMVQACMRMRLLGKGHTISFYSSDEAANAMNGIAAEKIGPHDAVHWAFQKDNQPINNNAADQLIKYSSEELTSVRNRILDSEISYVVMPDEQEQVDMLVTLIESEIAVLFDSGGLMSELSNQEVAAEWLNLADSDEWTAAAYFDENHVLMLKHGTYFAFEGFDLTEDIPFDESPYMNRPEKCVFYVDRNHLRDGSLMIGLTTRRSVCVTLCAGFKKDYLMQCSLLPENSLSILLFASAEAHEEIRSSIPSIMGSRHVMDWVCENSKKFEQDGLVYWAGSGINYAHKQTVEDVFYRTLQSDEDYENLGERCCDQDFLTLSEMYGEHRQHLLYTDVLRSHTERKKFQMSKQLSAADQSHWPHVNQKYDRICNEIVTRCSTKIGDKVVLGQLLDEEHEKENEEEAEEEQDISRPEPRTPVEHRLSPHVVKFMETRVLRSGLISGDIQSLYRGFIRTSFFVAQNWCADVFATRDFVNVIKSNNATDKEDEFLRTPNWIASAQKKGKITLLLLSPFEAHNLIPMIRSGKSVASIRMFAPRLVPRQSVLINAPKLALSPTSDAQVPVPRDMLAPLYLFSGTLYFKDEAEHNAFCYFTGIVPRDWTDVEQEYFDTGKIDKRGFLLKEHREEIFPRYEQFCKFEQHPEELVRGIIEARHGIFPESSHVAQIVLDCRRVSNFEN